MTIVWLGAPLGALSGSMLGGWIAQHSDWRLWFVGLSVPALVVGIAGLLHTQGAAARPSGCGCSQG